MRTVTKILSQLRQEGIKIWADNGRLRYKAPKGAMTKAWRAELKKRKAEILDFLRLAEQPNWLPPIKARPCPERLPLSFAQQRLYFLSQFGAANVAYNIPYAWHLSGPLDVAVLQQSLTETSRRHETLRTTFQAFEVQEGAPIQVIHEPADVPLPLINLQHLSPEPVEGLSQDAEVKRLLKEEAETLFNLETGPLLRASLLQLAAEEHVFVINMHHIIGDGWSMQVLMQELSTLYTAFLEGRASPLAPLAIQYRDFTLWQREASEGLLFGKQLAYWQKQLTNLTHLNLPTDHARPAVESFRGGHYPLTIEASLLAQLKTLSQQTEATLFMTLLAAFEVLLARVSGQTDIVVGTGIANRNRHEIEGLIGYFINSLVMRADLSDNPTFDDFLQQVRKVALAGMQNQDVPFEKVVEAVQPKRSAASNPLFQVMLVWQNFSMADVKLPGLSFLPLEVEFNSAKLDLILLLGESDGTLSIVFEYNRDLFERSTIERMAGHYQTLLRAIVANPAQRVADLPILTAAEQEQILFECNNTQTTYPHVTGHYLQHVFEEQVSKSPDAVALVFAEPGQIKVPTEEQLTYQALNERANQLAHYLIRQGVGQDRLVGLCVERSIDMVVGVLAILKAGGAYVPLDPTYPRERLGFMLEDAQVSILLTQAHLEANLPPHRAMTIKLDTQWELISRCSTRNPVVPMVPTQLAYVIYTSGSTGKPKGVLVSHKGLLNLALSQIEMFGVSLMSRVLQFASFSFDAAISEIAMALCSGASLYVAQKETLLPGPPLQQLLQQHQISHITLPPSALAVMNPQELPALQSLIVAGEASTTEQLKSWAKGRRVLNAYGPSEGTVCATMMDCSQPDEISSLSAPIGQAMNKVQLYILDDHLNPLPIGVPGELHIGGLGIARGYLNQPQLTASKFIPNPFSSKSGERLYKTGDLARYILSEEGLNIEFLGRIDHQVKIRGFRIELGEIEAVFSQHAQVRDVVVIVHKDKRGMQSTGPQAELVRLVAYLIPEVGASPTQAQLRRFGQQSLPDYMLPSAFVSLEAFPLTPNGKVDRRALSALDTQSLQEEAFVAPQTTAEKQLAAIWQTVLGVEQVGIHDNFFALGGDSIITIQIVSRARQVGLSLSARDIFQYQTIAQLASFSSNQLSIQTNQGLVTGTLPLTAIQHWFFDKILRDPHHFNQGSGILLVPANVSATHLAQAIQHLLAHHDSLRLRFRQDENGWQQAYSGQASETPFEVVDLSGLSPASQRVALEEKANQLQASLNLSDGPLMRVALFKLDTDTPARLLIGIHHLTVDAFSWRILLEDLATLYTQLSQAQAIQLPAKTSSYQDWAQRLNEYAQSEALIASYGASYEQWAIDAIPSLPIDTPDGQNTVASTEQISVSLSASETQALLQKVPSAYNTQINDVLLTALLQAFNNWSGQHDLWLNLEGHGREEIFAEIDLTRTVGWFTTVFPVHLTLDPSLLRGLSVRSDLGSALKQIKEQLRRIPNKGFDYGVLRYLSRYADEQPWPQPQVTFNYLGQFDQIFSDDRLFLGLGEEDMGALSSPQGDRSSVLDINGLVREGQLKFDWAYSRNLYDSATIEQLAQHFIAALRRLIEHCLSPQAGGYTPSDFPLTGLEQAELDNLLDRLAMGSQRDVDAIYPLSPLQEGLLFHTLYASEGSVELSSQTSLDQSLDQSVYKVQMVLTLSGPLNEFAFKQAWQAVVERHAILRTLFVWEGLEKPLQVVSKQVELPWQEEVHALGKLEEGLEAYLAADWAKPFDFEQAPLMRFALIRSGRAEDNRAYFVWTQHHIIIDGWSGPIILKEVLTAYQAILHGDKIDLPTAPAYENYVAWLQKQEREQAKVFWQEYLAGFTAPTPLVVDRSERHASDREGYVTHRWQLSHDKTTGLNDFAAQHHLTVNTLVQGAWALLLSRYSGQDDVCFGTVVSDRSGDVAGIESMVGLLLNTLPTYTKECTSSTALPWLQTLQAEQLKQRDYAYIPLTDIQQWSDVPAGTPLFESIVAFENYPLDNTLLEESALQVEIRSVLEPTHYPLNLIAGLNANAELELVLDYDASQFEAETIKRLAVHYEQLLLGMIKHPTQRLGTLPLLTAAERQLILHEWTKTETAYPKETSIHQLFEMKAEESPDAVAVVFAASGEQLSYRALNERANQLAHYLVGQGVGPEALVGICLERSIEMVVATLAILKAGGAYVPLDIAYPSERLAFMLSDTAISVLLTFDAWRSKFPQTVNTLGLDSAAEMLATQPVENLKSAVTADDLAYIMYTSGSTGRPKGVCVTQRNVVRLVQNTNFAQLTKQDVFLQLAPISFDASTLEIWGPLLNGGKLVLMSPGQPTLEELGLTIREHGITTLWLTAGLFHLMVDERLEDLRPLRQLLAGGDVLSVAHVQKVLANLPNCKLINGYGPTENTTFTCCFPMRHHASVANQKADQIGASVPIGRPIANTQVYILDDALQPVPVGVAGELYAGGDGVARGYHNRLELTAERFILNPYGAGRLYKTGDLARWRSDGNIEFLGRIDTQVKIRGFRVELGEIETRFNQHPQVRDVVVIVRQDTPGQKQLVAYLIPEGPHSPTQSELRQFGQASLPDYMLPSAFVTLDRFPLNPNGKIDRRALPAPTDLRFPSLSAGTFVSPRTNIEKQLAAIWQSVLGREQISIHDDFFALGGDSIISIQMVSRARQVGLTLSPRDIFEHQTIAQLAQVIGSAASEGKGEIQQGMVSGVLPLTPIQHWFFERPLHDPHHFNQSFMFKVPADLKTSPLEKAIQHLLVHHDALRLRFSHDENGWQQVNDGKASETPFELVDLSALSPAEQQVALEQKSNQLQTSLNLSEGPLMRVALFRLGTDTPARLLIIIHHLAVDGVSWRILLEDLATTYEQLADEQLADEQLAYEQLAYEQLSQGQTIALPAKTSSYQDWAHRLSDYAQSEALIASYEQWATSAIPALPMDMPHGQNTIASTAHIRVSLSEHQTQSLLEEVPSAYNTQINDVLLAALLQAFNNWTGEKTLWLNLEGHGREDIFPDIDLTRTVGWFTSIYPVQLTLSSHDPGSLLPAVKEQLRRIPNKGFDYGVLRYLSHHADKQPWPQPQVTFNYLGRFDQAFSGKTFLLGLAEENETQKEQSLEGNRSTLLDINGLVTEGQLRFDWAYSRQIYQPATIERLAEHFISALQRLIEHCLSPQAGGYTPSDFPTAGLEQAKLDNLLDRLGIKG